MKLAINAAARVGYCSVIISRLAEMHPALSMIRSGAVAI